MPLIRLSKSAREHAPQQQVLLLDEGWVVTPHIAAGLRNAGCSVHILTATSNRGLADAKYLGPWITREMAPPIRSEEYISAVETAMADWPQAQVLALTEPVMYRLWDTDRVWIDRVFPRCSSWQRELLRDKACLSRHVANAGLSIPRQISLRSAAHVDAAMQALGLPVVVKGAVSRGGNAVRIVDSPQDVYRAFAEFSQSGSVFLQQYIPGPTLLAGGLFCDGQPLRIYAAEKVESTCNTGPSLRLRSEADPALIACMLQVFQAMRWSGLASLDMMRDPDGGYCFIEFNPRPWGSIAACAKAGVHLFGPLAALLRGTVPEPDLNFAAGVEATLFPQVASTRLCEGNLRSLLGFVREPRMWLDAPWRDPGLTAHLARDIWWNWRKKAGPSNALQISEMPADTPVPGAKPSL